MKSLKSKAKAKRPRAVIVHSEASPSTPSTSKKNPYITDLFDKITAIHAINSTPSYTDISSSDYEDNDEGFIPAKKVKTPRPIPVPAPVTTRNRFNSLDESSYEVDHTTVTKSPTPPPVFIKDISSWKDILHSIQVAKINFKSARVVDNNIRVQPTTISDYRAIQALLMDKRIEYFSFRLKSEKPIQAVIRGLPPSVTCDEIIEDLKNRNLPVQSAHRLGKSGNLVVVHLDRNEAAKNIYDITNILFLSVKVESKHRSQLPGQCHRCQNFGHSSFRCHLKWRCVKCGENHATADCGRKVPDASLPPKCANCHGDHTANFRGCPSFQTAMNRKNNLKPPTNVSANLSFADALKSSLLTSSSKTTPPSDPQPSSPRACPPNQQNFDWLYKILTNFNFTSLCQSIKTFIDKLPLPPFLNNILHFILNAIPSFLNTLNSTR